MYFSVDFDLSGLLNWVVVIGDVSQGIAVLRTSASPKPGASITRSLHILLDHSVCDRIGWSHGNEHQTILTLCNHPED
jgi:hypothetical protein